MLFRSAMDKVAVSRAINNMIKEGLVSREFASEDKRRSQLSLSDHGKKTYEKIVPLVQVYEKDLLESLSVSEREALDKILEKLTRYVEKDQP